MLCLPSYRSFTVVIQDLRQTFVGQHGKRPSFCLLFLLLFRTFIVQRLKIQVWWGPCGGSGEADIKNPLGTSRDLLLHVSQDLQMVSCLVKCWSWELILSRKVLKTRYESEVKALNTCSRSGLGYRHN